VGNHVAMNIKSGHSTVFTLHRVT